MTGVCKLLPISHVKKVHLTTTSGSITLNNVLYVPIVQKNLLSITEFTNEYNCCIEFASNGFTIITRPTKLIIATDSATQLIYVGSSQISCIVLLLARESF